jgi:virginiamycin B lyase
MNYQAFVFVMALASAGSLYAASFHFTSVPTPSSQPTAIAVNPYASNAWFIEASANKIARFSFDDHSIQEYAIPTPNSDPRGIAVRYKDEIWFTEYGSSKVARLTGGVFTEFPTPTPDSGPTGIVSDGTSLWFAETKADKIVKVAPDNSMVEYPVPTPMAGPTELAVYFNQGTFVSFAEPEAGQIGILKPDGHVLEIPLPSAGARPGHILYAADFLGQAFWFSEPGVDKIGRMDYATNAISEYPIPTPASGPAGLAAGVDGFIYFAETDANKIGVLSPDGIIHEYPIPQQTSRPVGIVPTSNGYSFLGYSFTASGAASVGLIAPDRAFVVGAGYPPGWDSQFDFASDRGYEQYVSVGIAPYPGGVCPGQCFGQAYVDVPAQGTGHLDASSYGLAPQQITPIYLQPSEGLDLPTARIRAVNMANPAQAIEIPSIRVATLQTLDPSIFSFPGATRTGSAQSNLFLGLTTGIPDDLSPTTVRIEAFSAAGDLLATLERTFQPYPYLDLFDILAQLGIGELENGQIRVTRTSGNGTLWGILTTLGTDGSVAVSTGLNP